jgi:hypothetical protein
VKRLVAVESWFDWVKGAEDGLVMVLTGLVGMGLVLNSDMEV